MQLQFSPLQLQRFLRGCVLATAHALVTPPASVVVLLMVMVVLVVMVMVMVVLVVMVMR